MRNHRNLNLNRFGTAAQAYDARQAEIATLMAEFQSRLVDHAAARGATETSMANWGYAGDLAAVLTQLREANRILGGAGE
jgi:hypothetical protein